MKKFLKLSAIVIAALVVLTITSALIMSMVLDPNDYKDLVVTAVKGKTGRDLKIGGDIKLSVFPWLAVDIGAVELGNAPGFTQPFFARIDQAKIRVRLIPLLSKRLEAGVVTLEGFSVNLEKAKDGRTNWQDLAGPATGKTPEKKTGPIPPAALAIGGLDIREAAVTWEDHQTGQRITVDDIAIRTSAVSLVDPLDISVQFAIDSEQVGLKGTVSTEARIDADLKSSIYRAEDLKFAVDLQGRAIPGGRVDVTGTGAVGFDANSQRVDLSRLKLVAAPMTIPPYTVAVTLEAVNTVVDQTAMTVAVENLKIDGTLSGESLPGGEIPVSLTTRLAADLNRQTAVVDPLQIEALGIAASGSLSLDNLMSQPKGKGSLVVTRFNLREHLSRLVAEMPKTADPKALTAAEFSAMFTLSTESLQVDKLAMTLDDSHVTGTAGIKSFAAPKLAFNLNLDRLDLDRYLPPSEKGTSKSGAAGAAAAPVAGTAAAMALPVDSLRGLNVNGRLKVSALSVSGLLLENVDAGIQADAGRVKLSPMNAKLFDGHITGSTTLDVRKDQPRAEFEEKISGIRLDRLLKAMDIAPPDNIDVAGPSDITIKGAVTADKSGNVFQIERLTAKGNVGGNIPMGMDATAVLDLGRQRLTADKFKLQLAGLNLDAKFSLNGFSDQAALTADISAPPFNLRKLLAKLGLPATCADPKALTAVSVRAAIAKDADSLKVDHLNAGLDGATIKGDLAISGFTQPAYRFDLTVDALDADRYLPPPAKGKKQAAATPGAAVAAIPVDMLRGLRLDGKFGAQRFKFGNLNLQNIRLVASAKDGVIMLNPATMDLYGGTYTGNATIDARGKLPKISLDEKLSDIQVGTLLQDIQGKTYVSGLTSAAMKVTATGADADAIQTSLAGTVDFKMADGAIYGIDIVGKICQILTAYRAGSIKTEDIVGGVLNVLMQQAKVGKEAKLADRTKFSELQGSMVFSNGVGTNKDLVMNSPLLRVAGNGSLDLPRQMLDYQTTVALVESCEGQGGKQLAELANYPIPVRISGPFDNLSVQPDYTAGLMTILKASKGKPQPAATSPPKDAPEEAQTPPPEETRPADPKQQAEEAVKGLIEKGLKGLFK